MKEEKPTKNDFTFWRQLPISQLFDRHLAEVKQRLEENLSSGAVLEAEKPEIEMARIIGRIDMISDYLNLDYEDFVDEDSTDGISHPSET